MLKQYIYLFDCKLSFFKYLIIPIIFFISCNSKIEIKYIDDFAISEKKFDIDSNTNYFFLNLDYYFSDKGRQYFFNLDENNSSLVMYDYISANRIKKIKIPSNIMGFLVHSLDSIFLLTYMDNILYLSDTSGVIKNRWYLSFHIHDSIKYEAWANNFMRLHYINNKLYLYTLPMVKLKDKVKFPVLTIFTFLGDSIIAEKKLLYFTKKYFDFKYMTYFPYISVNHDNDIIVSYEIEDSLYVINNKYLENKYFSKSNFIDSFKVFDNDKWINKQYNKNYHIEAPTYGQVIYDKYRKLYYRIVKHSQLALNKDGSKNDFFDRSWSILVFDSNFKLLKEVYMHPKKYRFNDLILTIDGLLISNCNENDSNFNPNQLSFIVLNIENEK